MADPIFFISTIGTNTSLITKLRISFVFFFQIENEVGNGSRCGLADRYYLADFITGKISVMNDFCSEFFYSFFFINILCLYYLD